MTITFHRNRWVRRSAMLLLLLLVGYAGVAMVRGQQRMKQVKKLQAEFTSAEARAWTPEQRREKGEQMRSAMENLSESQREQLAAERRQREEESLRQYAAMSPTEKAQYLDRQIDRGQQMRQQMAQRPPSGNSPRPAGGSRGNRPPSTPEEREKRRKERLDQSTPELRALRDMVRKDMNTRRQQRGIVSPGPCRG